MKKNLFFTFLLLFTFTWTMAQKAPTVVRNDQQRRADIAKLVYVSPFTQINGDYFSDKMEKNSKLSEKEDQFPSNPAKVTYTKKSMDFASKGVIFTDGFEHAGTSGVWENDPSNDYDWTFIKNSTSGGGAITGDNTTGTGYFAYFDSYSADKDDIGLLNSPTIDLSGTTSAKLDFFWNRKNAGYTSRLEVNIFADGTWNNDIQPGLDQQTTGWESVTVDLAAYAFNDVVVQFKVVGDWWRNIGLDDVLVYEPQPYSFAVNYPQGTVVSVAGSCLYTVTINNTGTSADNFTPAIATGGSWSYELLQADGVTPLTEVMSIPSGGSADYKIKVTAPATGLVDGDTDTQEFSITSAEGGKAVENFSITTTFITPLYLPIYDGFEEGNTNQQPVASWDMVKVTGTEGWLANSAQTSYNRTPRTGSFNAHLKYNNTAWLFTKKPVALEAAELYRFSVYARQDGATATNASITLKYGTSATAAGMTYVAKALTGVVAGDYQLIEGLFSPEADGIYYLGVLGTINGSPWYISIDDISVEEVPGIEPALTSITAPNPINWALSNEEVKVVLKNNGAQNLTAAQISWSVAGAEQTPFEWAGDLVMGASEEVTIGTFDFTEFGEFEIIANVIVAEDNDETNNTVSTTVCFYEPFELPYATEFNGNLDVWSSLSIVGGKYFTWTTVGGAFGGQLESTTAENGYAMFDNLNGTEIGVNPAEAALVSPIFDLTGIANALMSFEYMARQLGKDFDVAYPNLLIKVEGSNDGFNADIQELWSYQFPDEAHMFNDGKVYVNLTPIANQANVQIRFRYIGGGGYWWLIDDVNMWETPANDIMVNDVMFSQDINMAGSDVVISVSVLNVGGVDQTDVDVTVNVNGTDFVANIPAIAVLEEIVVPVTWTAAVAGRHTITATLPDDENNENNTGTTQGVVVAEGQLAEGFEGTWVPTLWEAETGWINWDQVWSAQWEGTKGAACGSQYGFSNSKLITPLLQIGANEELNFYATVGNPIADPKTSIQVMYSADKVTWTAIGDLIELTEEMKLYTIDLASLTGNYYLAFSASGAASGSTWATWAIVDHVVGPNPVPFYEVTLNTTDQDAAALSGVKVVYEGIVSGTVTTVGGTATVLLCDGAYNYTATKANYYEVTGIIVVDGINVTEDIQLDAYPTVTFSVQDQVPDNLAGVSIKYVGITTEVTGSLTTLADGTVTFRLPADTYTYTATKANYYAIEGSVVV
ncbi:MAG: choice-of-anchor J domain-containing protein, partial [Salinivirgaceae bacterium]|nr:choice-of-anchor J domain-containing protein [Salinivirgaceae bacterium]